MVVNEVICKERKMLTLLTLKKNKLKDVTSLKRTDLFIYKAQFEKHMEK